VDRLFGERMRADLEAERMLGLGRENGLADDVLPVKEAGAGAACAKLHLRVDEIGQDLVGIVGAVMRQTFEAAGMQEAVAGVSAPVRHRLRRILRPIEGEAPQETGPDHAGALVAMTHVAAAFGHEGVHPIEGQQAVAIEEAQRADGARIATDINVFCAEIVPFTARVT
jgi:hypothetical protein